MWALQEKATSRSKPQSGQRTRAKPRARMPQLRYARSSRSTKAGRPRPCAVRALICHRNTDRRGDIMRVFTANESVVSGRRCGEHA